MYSLELKYHFDSSHQLKLDYPSACQNIHGHRWNIVVGIRSEVLDKNGMIIDFKHLKGVIDRLDHKHLNDVVKFNPTAENISKYLYDEIKNVMFEKEIPAMLKVTVFESPDASITYAN